MSLKWGEVGGSLCWEKIIKMVENKGAAAKGKIPLLSVLDHFRR